MTDTETAIMTIWKSNLEITDLSLDSSYFELGGDSLRMIDMLLVVGERLNREIDPGILFEDATLRGFAKRVTELPTLSQSFEGEL